MDEAVEFIYSADQRRRVAILLKPGGVYTYREEYHYRSEYAERWVAMYSRTSYYDSLQTARREVAFNFDWLIAERNTA